MSNILLVINLFVSNLHTSNIFLSDGSALEDYGWLYSNTSNTQLVGEKIPIQKDWMTFMEMYLNGLSTTTNQTIRSQNTIPSLLKRNKLEMILKDLILVIGLSKE